MAAATEGRSATIREVYALVDETRTELSSKIDDLRETVSDLVTSHEHRLTVVETTQASHATRLTAVEAVAGKLAEEHATAKGHFGAAAWVAGGVFTLMAGFGGTMVARVLGA